MSFTAGDMRFGQQFQVRNQNIFKFKIAPIIVNRLLAL